MNSTSAVAIAVAFVEAINRADLERVVALLSPQHTLRVFDEPAVVGRDANERAWLGYLRAFPRYTIHLEHVAVRGNNAALLGRTTGSHLQLPDADEWRESVIWLATARDGQLDAWTLIEDSSSNRSTHGLPVSVGRIVDHVDLQVCDLRASRAFYETVLKPLGYRVVLEDPASGSIAMGTPGYDDFGLKQSNAPTQRAHIAFAAASTGQVDRFYARALEFGAHGHGAPGYRPHYGAGYYAAFVYDPDGNNIEAVCHEQRR